MRTFLFLVAGLFLPVLAGCSMETVDGSGNVVVEQRDVSGSSSISLAGAGELIIQQTGKESLSITADDNLLPHLTSEVSITGSGSVDYIGEPAVTQSVTGSGVVRKKS